MRRLFEDTHPDAEAVLIRLMREAPIWRKMAIIGQMNEKLRWLAGSMRRQTNQEAGVMGDLFEGLFLVTEVLERLGVRYYVGGSLASATYGIPRTTLDADIITDLQAAHIDPFVAALGDDFYVDGDSVREAVALKSSFNLIHHATMFKIDIFIPKDRPADQARFDNRILRAFDEQGEHLVYLSSPEDVVLAKLEWYKLGHQVSDRQWQDILGVVRVQENRLVIPYLRRWAAELGVADLLERALTQAGQG
jgi:hypothetical protein